MSKSEGGRWRVRWRELVRQPDGSLKPKQREKTVYSEAAAIELRAKVLRSLDIGELPQVLAVREIPACCSLDVVIAGWLRAQKAHGAAANSLRVYGQRMARVLAALRARHEIPEDKGVPANLLTRNEVTEVTLYLQDVAKLAQSNVSATIATLLRVWAWGCDDPGAYPGLLPAPRDTSILVPKAPIYRAPPAPTMAECDAVLRVLAAMLHPSVALPAAVIARCTGLRMGQVIEIRAADIELSAATLTVREGKSRREKAERRTVPIAPVLVDYLAPLLAARKPTDGPFLLPRRSDATRAKGRKPDATLRAAWEEATGAGETRREVWDPPDSSVSRPGHAFRAAFQHHLVTMGVRDEVIDALVGYAPSLRGRHYVDASARWAAMVEAVATIPPIAWEAAQLAAEGGEVIPFPA